MDQIEAARPASGGRAADWVVSQIEDDILSGVLENGTPLPAERELMERFKTSRTVVREAITTLSSRADRREAPLSARRAQARL